MDSFLFQIPVIVIVKKKLDVYITFSHITHGMTNLRLLKLVYHVIQQIITSTFLVHANPVLLVWQNFW